MPAVPRSPYLLTRGPSTCFPSAEPVFRDTPAHAAAQARPRRATPSGRTSTTSSASACVTSHLCALERKYAFPGGPPPSTGRGLAAPTEKLASLAASDRHPCRRWPDKSCGTRRPNGRRGGHHSAPPSHEASARGPIRADQLRRLLHLLNDVSRPRMVSRRRAASRPALGRLGAMWASGLRRATSAAMRRRARSCAWGGARKGVYLRVENLLPGRSFHNVLHSPPSSSPASSPHCSQVRADGLGARGAPSSVRSALVPPC